MESVGGTIALIELHDARIASFKLHAGGQVEIEIPHIVTFHQIAKEDYDVWSYSARINLVAVSCLELSGEITKDNYISDAKFIDGEGNTLSWEQLAAGAPAKRLDIDFASGATMTIVCKSAHLSLVERVRFVEKWTGPLTTPAS